MSSPPNPRKADTPNEEKSPVFRDIETLETFPGGPSYPDSFSSSLGSSEKRARVLIYPMPVPKSVTEPTVREGEDLFPIRRVQDHRFAGADVFS